MYLLAIPTRSGRPSGYQLVAWELGLRQDRAAIHCSIPEPESAQTISSIFPCNGQAAGERVEPSGSTRRCALSNRSKAHARYFFT